jgi:hypothetical protein
LIPLQRVENSPGINRTHTYLTQGWRILKGRELLRFGDNEKKWGPTLLELTFQNNMDVVCVTVTTSLIYVALLWTPPNPHPILVDELETVSFGWQFF